MRGKVRHPLWWIGLGALAVSVWFVVRAVDPAALGMTWRALVDEPLALTLVLSCYSGAFVLRALVWRSVLPGLGFGHALAALHVSLAGNHVLPFRLGEALRVTSAVRRTTVGLAPATASTLLLRAADVLAVIGLAAVLGPRVVGDLVGSWGWALLFPAAAVWLAGLWWLGRLDEGARSGRSLGIVALGAAAAWVLESVVLWQTARWAGMSVGFSDAVLVTAVTIVAQSVAVTPGGIGTYEAAAGAAFVAVGGEPGAALAAAVAAHAVKTAYALAGGALALFVPAPSAFGRLRLPPGSPHGGPGGSAIGKPVRPEQPIVLFMPAHNEAESVARVVRRTPARLCGRPVVCVVVDDGSSDDTAERARGAGAEVVSCASNRGLGHAVRIGLRVAIERGAAAVAFCDADGEYAPEELERLIAPVLSNEADYVVGSRFRGDIRRMPAHRRAGNIVLTRLLSFVARRTISDGQSGYRAFSMRAADDAEIIHDYNYAQVLTLDLLAKGYRYAEVPITYSFRTTGRSFVRPGRYLRHVVPAVHAELNG